jgi:hypothetical protein
MESSLIEESLRAEIRQFETHLAHIAAEDDSAYGKARIRLYENLLHERRLALDALTAPSASRDYL